MASRIPLPLDEEGFREASAVLVRTEQELQAVGMRAAERLEAGTPARLDGTVVLMLFETPKADTARVTLSDLYAYRDRDSPPGNTNAGGGQAT